MCTAQIVRAELYYRHNPYGLDPRDSTFDSLTLSFCCSGSWVSPALGRTAEAQYKVRIFAITVNPLYAYQLSGLGNSSLVQSQTPGGFFLHFSHFRETQRAPGIVFSSLPQGS